METPEDGPKRRTLGLPILFGTIYFIQGIGEPTEGIISQPVNALLRGWGHSPAQIGAFAALVALPWSFKPLYGLLTDFVPLFGSHRKSYLVATSALASGCLLVLYLVPLPLGSYNLLLLGVLLATFAVAFGDVVVDALIVSEGQRQGRTGPLQAVAWGAMSAGGILGVYLGGFLDQHNRQQLSFLLCSTLMGVALVLSAILVREPPATSPRRGFRVTLRALRRIARSRTILAMMAFLVLWSFNPLSSSLLYLYSTEQVGLTPEFHGTTRSLIEVAALAASIVYGLLCRRVPARLLRHGAIILGILSSLAYWALLDETTAVLVAVFVGFTYMTGWLIQLDLLSRVCPPRLAATVFALLMATSNFSASLSTWLGGHLYDRVEKVAGARTAFCVLPAVAALATATCWLVAPWVLRRHRGESESSARPLENR